MIGTEHPRHKLVDGFTNPVRFLPVAGLAGVEQIGFAIPCNHLQVFDSVLSRQVNQLEGLGVVAVRKGCIKKHPRTWFSLTPKGRKLRKSHLATLRVIAEDSTLAASGNGSWEAWPGFPRRSRQAGRLGGVDIEKLITEAPG